MIFLIHSCPSLFFLPPLEQIILRRHISVSALPTKKPEPILHFEFTIVCNSAFRAAEEAIQLSAH